MNISLIPLSWKIGAGVALVGALAAAGVAYHHHVYQAGYDRAVSDRAARDVKQERLDTAKADKETKDRQDKANSDAIARQQEKEKYEATIEDLRIAARRGNSGMRAPGACLPAASTGASASASPGPVAEEGYVLLPETAESVLDAASELRQGVLDRNALIDKYNMCRDAANTP